ncbi:hypothetical protein ACFVWL_11435 [Microbacterium sp. NPDC058269]|uniref:hypothetical protein n=1 Tax=Microbacterium sp. NPDC058269 TaxID=3346414 RepID=UPI0036DDAC87
MPDVSDHQPHSIRQHDARCGADDLFNGGGQSLIPRRRYDTSVLHLVQCVRSENTLRDPHGDDEALGRVRGAIPLSLDPRVDSSKDLSEAVSVDDTGPPEPAVQAVSCQHFGPDLKLLIRAPTGPHPTSVSRTHPGAVVVHLPRWGTVRASGATEALVEAGDTLSASAVVLVRRKGSALRGEVTAA